VLYHKLDELPAQADTPNGRGTCSRPFDIIYSNIQSYSLFQVVEHVLAFEMGSGIKLILNS
jgi:hypothetical protein